MCIRDSKDIGQGSSGDDEYADSGAPDPREEMRYPFNAASRPQERVLYNINRPSVMEHIQNYNHSLVAPRGEEENSRLTTPRQSSPFRQ